MLIKTLAAVTTVTAHTVLATTAFARPRGIQTGAASWPIQAF
jgi:hypothetical protein